MSRLNKRPQINIDEVSQEERHPVEAFMTPQSMKVKKKERPGQQLFYLDEELRSALKIMAAVEKKDLSELAGEALEQFIPEKYKKMAREQD